MLTVSFALSFFWQQGKRILYCTDCKLKQDFVSCNKNKSDLLRTAPLLKHKQISDKHPVMTRPAEHGHSTLEQVQGQVCLQGRPAWGGSGGLWGPEIVLTWNPRSLGHLSTPPQTARSCQGSRDVTVRRGSIKLCHNKEKVYIIRHAVPPSISSVQSFTFPSSFILILCKEVRLPGRKT